MKTENIKWILLGAFLILDGLLLVGLKFAGLPLAEIAGICGIIAGVFFLINR